MIRFLVCQLVGGDEHQVCESSAQTLPRRGEVVCFPTPLASEDPDFPGNWKTWAVERVRHNVEAEPPWNGAVLLAVPFER